ncbi:MAG: DsbA family protein, partial [Moraxella sp.]|nr:DsbA family protein [Moraxella sp.]
TGVIFSQDYKKNILKVGNPFDSYHSLLAITATQNIAPHRALEVLSALQMARYADGRDNQDLAVIADILNTLGLSEVVEDIKLDKTNKALQENIHFGQSLAKHLNIQGVPQLVIEHDGGWLVVPNQALHDDGQALLEYLGQFDDKNGE